MTEKSTSRTRGGKRPIAQPFDIRGSEDWRTSSVDSMKILATGSEVTFLRLPDVKALTGLSKTSLYSLIREQDFPAPVRLGPRSVAWVRSEVNQWAADRVRASRFIEDRAARKLPLSVRTDLGGASRKSA
jgi:prophage regulatory protein